MLLRSPPSKKQKKNSDFGHDKSLFIKPYNKKPSGQRPLTFYCGDGVSDLSAARETDLLFAKHGQGIVSPPPPPSSSSSSLHFTHKI